MWMSSLQLLSSHIRLFFSSTSAHFLFLSTHFSMKLPCLFLWSWSFMSPIQVLHFKFKCLRCILFVMIFKCVQDVSYSTVFASFFGSCIKFWVTTVLQIFCCVFRSFLIHNICSNLFFGLLLLHHSEHCQQCTGLKFFSFHEFMTLFILNLCAIGDLLALPSTFGSVHVKKKFFS